MLRDKKVVGVFVRFVFLLISLPYQVRMHGNRRNNDYIAAFRRIVRYGTTQIKKVKNSAPPAY
jgi:hypothetical protein